jgi:hypothetical protein
VVVSGRRGAGPTMARGSQIAGMFGISTTVDDRLCRSNGVDAGPLKRSSR